MEKVAAPLQQTIIAKELRGIGLNGIPLCRNAVGNSADEQSSGDIRQVLEKKCVHDVLFYSSFKIAMSGS